jgi:hypothetical protein
MVHVPLGEGGLRGIEDGGSDGMVEGWNEEVRKDKSQISNKPQIPMTENSNRFGI